jgi:hypothetical protein
MDKARQKRGGGAGGRAAAAVADGGGTRKRRKGKSAKQVRGTANIECIIVYRKLVFVTYRTFQCLCRIPDAASMLTKFGCLPTKGIERACMDAGCLLTVCFMMSGVGTGAGLHLRGGGR